MKEERKLRKSKKWIALAASFAVLMSCFSGFATVSAFGADTPVSAYSASDVYPLMATSYTGWQRPTSSQSVKTGLYVNTTTSLTDGGSATYTNLDFGSDGLDQIKIVYTGFNRADTVMDVYLGTDNTGTTIASITLPKGSKWGRQLYVTADLLEGVSVTGVQNVYFKIRGLAVKYSDNSWDNIFDFTGLTFIKKTGTGTPVASAAVAITAPVSNASPANASTASEEFSVTSTVWKKGGEVFTGKFKYGDTYTASVTLTANGNMGYAFDASTTVAEIPGATVSNVTVTGEGEGNTLTFDAAFDSVAGIDAYSASAVYPSMATAKTGWKNGTGSNGKVLMVDTATCTTVEESALYTDLDFGPKGLGRVEILYSACNSVPLTLEIFQGTDATGTKIGEISIKGNNWAVNQTAAADIAADVKGVQSIYLKVDGIGVNTDKANNIWDNVFDFRGLTFVEKTVVYPISGFTPIEPRNHTIGSSAAPLPAQVEAVYEDGSKAMVSVTWDTSAYDLNRAGTYTVTGTVDGTDLKPTVTLVVYEPVDGSYSVSGTFELKPGSDTEGTYTVKTALKGMKAVAGTFGLAYDDSIMTLQTDGIAYTNGAKTAGVTLPAGTNYVMAGWISSDAGGQSPIDASVAPVEILTFSFDMSKRNYDLMLDRDSLGIYQYTGGDTSLWDNGGYLIDSGTAYAFAANNSVSYTHDDRYLTTITALSGAAIEIGGYTLTADGAGQVKLALANGSVAYKASKTGYRTAEGTLTANNGGPLTIAMTEQGYYSVVKTITGGAIVGADRASDSADYTFTVEADEPNVTPKVVVTVNGAAVSPQVSGNTYTVPAAKITGDIEIVVTFVGPVNAYSASDVYPLMATSYTGWQRPTSSQSVKTGLYVNTTTSLTDGGSATYANLDFGSDGLYQIKIGYTGFNRADTVMDVYLGTDNTGTTIASITLPKGSRWGTQVFTTADLLEGVSVTGVQDVHFKIRGLAVKYSDNSWDNIFDFTSLTFIKKTGVGTPVASASVSITAPVSNASPANASTASKEFSVTSTVWKKGGEVFTGKFKYGDTYTASVTLTANGNMGYTFDASTTVAEIPGAMVSNVTVTGEGEGNTLTFDAAFDSVAGIDAYSASAVYPSMATAKTGWRTSGQVLMVDIATCKTLGESAVFTDLDFGSRGLDSIQILYGARNSQPLTLDIYLGSDDTGTKIAEMTWQGNADKGWQPYVTETGKLLDGVTVTGVHDIYMKVRGLGAEIDKTNNIWDNVFDFRGLTFVEKTAAPTPGGVTVSGAVKSYNPQLKTQIYLYAAGADITVTSAAVYTADIVAAAGNGQVEQRFEISGVAEGNYTLVIRKNMHLPFKVEGIRVGSTNLDLTQSGIKEISCMTLPLGDINNDEIVNGLDSSVISSNFGTTAATADLNRDGIVNGLDASFVSSSFGQGMITVTSDL